MSLIENIHSVDNLLHLPIVIGIGAPKCGTTWFYEAIKKSPHISASVRKEISFFSSDKKYDRGIQWYLDHFAFEDKNATRKTMCEISVSYCYNPAITAKRISQHFPHAKIVLFVRDPKERVKSHVDWLRQLEYGKNYGFSEVLSRHPEIIQSNDYRFIIENYLQYFDKDQLCIIRHQSIQNDSVSSVKRFFSFLGLEHDNLNRIRKEKIGKTITPRFRFLEKMRISIYKTLTRNGHQKVINLVKLLKIPEFYRTLNDNRSNKIDLSHVELDEFIKDDYHSFTDWVSKKQITII